MEFYPIHTQDQNWESLGSFFLNILQNTLKYLLNPKG